MRSTLCAEGRAPRLVEPSRRLFVVALIALSGASAVSIVAPVFAVLVLARGVAGLALGVLTWLAYSQVFGDAERTGDIAVIGPLTGVVAAPLFGVALGAGELAHGFAVVIMPQPSHAAADCGGGGLGEAEGDVARAV